MTELDVSTLSIAENETAIHFSFTSVFSVFFTVYIFRFVYCAATKRIYIIIYYYYYYLVSEYFWPI